MRPRALAASDGRLKGLCLQPLRRARCQGIAHDFARIKIFQGREIQKSFSAGRVCEIGYPDLVEARCGKTSFENIGGHGQVVSRVVVALKRRTCRPGSPKRPYAAA